MDYQDRKVRFYMLSRVNATGIFLLLTAITAYAIFGFAAEAVAAGKKVKHGLNQAGENSATKASKDEIKIDDIVVTAEKRDGKAQDIPASVTVVTEEQLEDFGLASTLELVDLVPNLYMTQTGNTMMTTFAAMRGVMGAMTQTPVVGFYVDDVYYSGLDISLFDVERVEVLRGPQGTLYGRNSEAGIINVITKQPTPNWETKLKLGVASFDTYQGQGSVSGPLLDDKLKFRAAARYYETRGYFENKFDGSDDGGRGENTDGRVTLQYAPRDDLELTLGYDLQRFDGNNAQYAPLKQGNLRENVNVDCVGKSEKNADGTYLRARYQMGGMKLISISSFRKEDYSALNDLDATPLDMMTLGIAKDVSAFSQEIRLLSDREDSAFRWIGGLFILSEEDQRQYDTWMNFKNMGMGMPGETLAQKSTTDTFGMAAFAEATYTFLERLSLTLGLRYDWEGKDFDYEQTTSGPVMQKMGYMQERGSVDDSFDAWLPKASLSYKLNESMTPYLSVSRGFLSGGFNAKQQMGSTYKPEFIWSYELGAKTRWLNGRVELNAALFYIDWSDMQVEIRIPGGTSAYIENAGKATSKGAELELIVRPVKGLLLMAGFAYTDATYDDYAQGANVYDGNRITDSPQYTVNLGMTYRFMEGLFINAGYNHFGKVYFDPANTQSQENYGLLNVKIGYETGHFDVYLYGRNLLDEEYATRAYQVNNVWYGRAGEPQIFGLMLTARF
ncbi:hypothetical protein AAU61_10820 [Desulfocarbo indianensis]|nr:hypothetical protein AAU61_10820 [Desulfocarbo indianensis]